MTEATEVYVNNERVKIIREVRADYLIEDVATGKQYLIDKSYFHKRYLSEREYLPIHTEVWQKLENQAMQLHQLRRANSRLKNKLRKLRKQTEEKRAQSPESAHYRNGRKRGRFGHNG